MPGFTSIFRLLGELSAADFSEHPFFFSIFFVIVVVVVADGIGDVLSHLRKQVEMLFNTRYGKLVINTSVMPSVGFGCEEILIAKKCHLLFPNQLLSKGAT